MRVAILMASRTAKCLCGAQRRRCTPSMQSTSTSTSATTTTATATASAVVQRQRQRQRRPLPRPPSAYNSMLPTDDSTSVGSNAAPGNDDDLVPLSSGRSVDVCGSRLALGELRVEFPGAEPPPSSSSSRSPRPPRPPPPPVAVLHVPTSVEEVMDAYIKSGNADADPYW